ncbi:MAG: hypothetical protein JWP27_2990 [Flaviaesturariibacter sp.]|nr:hypothetical protein [Flaviaesturariibacter sp.]
MIKFYTLVFIAGCFLFSCRSAGKAATSSYDKGNYADAVSYSVKKLQKDPADGETRALLQAAYRNAVDVSESRIRSLSAGADYEAIYNEYRRLQSLYETVRPYPSLVTLVKAADYASYVSTYGQKIAEAHVDKGLAEMDKDDKKAYQAAYREFKTALRYQDDALTRSRMQTAFDAAVIHIVVTSVQAPFGSRYALASYRLHAFEEKMMRDVRYAAASEFIQLHSEDEARARRIVPDQVIELRLGRIDLNRPSDETRSRTVSREVVVKEIVYRADSVVKQYGVVLATIETTKRIYTSGGDLYLTVLDAQGRVLWSDRMSGEYQWVQEYSDFRGDIRALSSTERDAMGKRDRVDMRDEEVEDRVMDEIGSDLRYRLRSYFSRLD